MIYPSEHEKIMQATNYIENWDECVQHILSCYPNEGGGIVTSDNIFHPIVNCSETPEDTYEFSPNELAGKEVKCILHSHTYDPDKPPRDDPRSPSKTDLQGQIDTAVEWAIVICEGENVTQPVFWGDYDHRPDLWNREFIHSIQDCFAFMADYQYQKFGIKLPFHPRDLDWFEKGENHVEDVWQDWGFVDVTGEPEMPGDVYFYQIQSAVPNHVSVVVEPNIVAHHLAGSRRMPKTEPSSVWHKYVTRKIRHRLNPAFKKE